MYFSTINPATDEILAKYELMQERQVLNIAEQTHNAQEHWKRLTLAQRFPFFKKLAEQLRREKEAYATLITKEMGKPIRESRAEVEKCAFLAEALIDKAPQWLAEEKVSADGLDNLIIFEPLGVVFIIMPWNFPFWQSFKVALPPLMAGNGILLKHARNVTGCSLAIEEVFKKAGFPPHLFRSIIVDHSLTEGIIASSHIHACSLTGSEKAGQLVGELSGKHLKKVVLELGCSDPFIVLEDADIVSTARNAVLGRFTNAGQVCISSKRFFVSRKIASVFIDHFVALTKQLIIGDPLDEKTQLGPLVNKKAVDEMEAFVQEAVKKGAKILTGGKPWGSNGAYFEPTILSEVTEEMQVSCKETFGPLAPIFMVETEEEMLRLANNHCYGLAGSIWTKDIERGKALARKLETGGVFINSIVKSHPSVPLGGIKRSGFGRELSHYGIKEFVNVKSINVYRK